jgi:hypothetical protein
MILPQYAANDAIRRHVRSHHRACAMTIGRDVYAVKDGCLRRSSIPANRYAFLDSPSGGSALGVFEMWFSVEAHIRPCWCSRHLDGAAHAMCVRADPTLSPMMRDSPRLRITP